MSIAKRLVPGFIKARYLDIKKRLNDLETSVRCLENAIDAMVVSPKYLHRDDIGFNGQLGRKRIFTDIQSSIAFEVIVETGTWVGNSTGYMATITQRPIYSCETSPRFHALSKIRLAELQRVHLELSDSRRFLHRLSKGELVEKCVFFYLDAHWYEDLPLAEEIEIIASNWRRFVVMIDDFKVPDDPGYGYDNYGPGKALTIELLTSSIKKYRLVAYYPALPSVRETGTRRGCVVLAPGGDLSEKLSRVSSLKQLQNA